MKVFVYNKKDNKKLAQINDVHTIKHDKQNKRLIVMADFETLEIDIAIYKTTIYQN